MFIFEIYEYMNILYYSRVHLYATLYDSVDINKLIKSIKNLNNTNKIFKLTNSSCK